MKTCLLFTLLSPIFVYATDTLPMGRVVYEQRFDLAEDYKLNGTAILLFNREASLYINADAPKSDHTVPDENPNYLPRFVGGDPEGFLIYKDHRTRKITFKTLCYWPFQGTRLRSLVYTRCTHSQRSVQIRQPSGTHP